jgi:hypothetical protein
MTSFLACHKKVNRFSPSRNPAELAPLAGLKEEERLLPRPRSTRTNPSALGLAHRWRRREKSWLSVFSTLAIGFVWLTLPLRAQFAYVANGGSNNVSAYRIGADGSLTQLTTSPFPAGSFPRSVAITPLVPFASSFATLEIANDSFDLKESFTLGANSKGIKPVKEKVTLQIGTFSVTIPAGSFHKPLFSNGFEFVGVIKGVSLDVQIVPLGNKRFTFNAAGTGVNLAGLTNPVTVVLTIGVNSGTTTVPK